MGFFCTNLTSTSYWSVHLSVANVHCSFLINYLIKQVLESLTHSLFWHAIWFCYLHKSECLHQSGGITSKHWLTEFLFSCKIWIFSNSSSFYARRGTQSCEKTVSDISYLLQNNMLKTFKTEHIFISKFINQYAYMSF